MKKQMVFLMMFACLVVSAPATLFAAGANYSLGAGAAMVPDYEGSDDMTGVPALFFSADWQEGYFIKLMGNSIRANVFADKTWTMGPVLQYRAKRNSDVDNSAVSDMRKIDAAIEGGVFIGYAAEGWDARLQWVGDLSNTHDGSLVKLNLGYAFREANLRTRIGMSTTYASDDYMDTYFSVDANNAARSGLSRYSADGGIKDIGVDLSVRYGINAQWDVMGLLGYTALLNDAKDSPVVDDEGDSNQFSVGLMAIYNF